MKNKLAFILLCLTVSLSAYDLKTVGGTVYKNYVGLGGAAPDGIVVFYGKDCKEVVIPVAEFPPGFKDIKTVKKMAERIPEMKEKADAEKREAKAKKRAEAKANEEKQKRLQQVSQVGPPQFISAGGSSQKVKPRERTTKLKRK